MNYIRSSFTKLKDYCEREDFKGWDPFDGLNSRFFQRLALLKGYKHIRLGWLQFFKRFPYNLRPFFLIDKDYNPKGLGLFLSGYCHLYSIDRNKEYLEKIDYLIEKLLSLQSKGYSGSCWGYNFNWQARAFYLPRFTPSVVVSSFIGQAILDAFDITKDHQLFETARSVCEFIIKDLNRAYDKKGNFAFSYSPLDESIIFNASLLGSRMLARVYSYTKEKALIEQARRSVQFCCNYQRPDGSWSYGALSYHQWIDSFHTGYNLESLSEYENFSGDKTYRPNIERGLDYYLNNFFTKEGIPRYNNTSTYPADAHSAAQLVITLYKLSRIRENEKLLQLVLGWVIRNMQDREGFFYYQVRRGLNCRIPYMRWVQAWMFYALAVYLNSLEKEK